MSKIGNIVIAVKCAPDNKIFCNIQKAGLEAVELYLSKRIMNDLQRIKNLCRNFSFRYAVHAPSDYYNLDGLAELVDSIEAKIVVFHNIYWEHEWADIIKIFKKIKTNLCIENTYSVHEPLKFMRKYQIGRCLDLEHLQIECAGVYEEEFIPVIKQASHIHLTGYVYGSQLWHTHIHYSMEHNFHMLDLMKKAGYSGFVVSEGKVSLQTYEEFEKLNRFKKLWESKLKTERSNP